MKRTRTERQRVLWKKQQRENEKKLKEQRERKKHRKKNLSQNEKQRETTDEKNGEGGENSYRYSLLSSSFFSFQLFSLLFRVSSHLPLYMIRFTISTFLFPEN
jgi:hypothetical protein